MCEIHNFVKNRIESMRKIIILLDIYTNKKVIFLISIFSVLLILTGCPSIVVNQLEKMIPDDSLINKGYKPLYLRTTIPADKLMTLKDSVKIEDTTQKSASFIKLDLQEIDSKDYPDKIELRASVYDTTGLYITGLAPPFFSLSGNYRDYWNKLTDSCQGFDNDIKEFDVTEIKESTSESYAICFVLDHSPSMGDQRAERLQHAVKLVCTAIKKGDYVAVVKFSSKMTIEVPLTSNKDEYRNKIKVDGLKGKYGAGTAMYKGVLTGINEVKKADRNYKKIVILFSDGGDNQWKGKTDSVFKMAKDANVKIYTIAYGLTEEAPLRNLADFTGGRFYRIYSSKEFPYVFKSIYFTLNNYYKITYKPPECAGLHKVRAHLNLKELTEQELSSEGTYDKSIFTALDPIGTITFVNIEFDFGKSSIKSESMNIIEQMANELKEHESIIIKITGHTDDVGTDEFNMNLSLERAKSVRQELIRLGISAKRLSIEGMGESKPLYQNDNDDNRRKNRRTEFTIIER
jgi:VWFA-related protein